MKSFRLTFPEHVEPEAVADMLSVLAGEPHGSLLHPVKSTTSITLITTTAVSWWVRLDGRRAHRLQAAAQQVLPGLAWVEAIEPQVVITKAVELRASGGQRPLDTDLAAATAGRLLGISGELNNTEAVLVQWQIGSTVTRSPIPPTSSAPPRSVWSLPEWRTEPRTSEEASAARRKQERHVFAAIGRVAIAGATGRRADQLIAAAIGAYQLLAAPGVSITSRWLPPSWVAGRLDSDTMPRIGQVMRLSAIELAAVIGWPVGNPALPGVRYQSSVRLRVDERCLVTRPAAGTRLIGTTAHPAQSTRPVGQRVEDGLRHLHLLGPTGVGKSTLVASLVLADIAAGRSAVAVDPKGDLVEAVLARVTGREAERIVVLDPMDAAPVGFNPLDSDRLGIDGVLHVLHSLWKDSWGPRLGDVLHAGLLTLTAEPGHSLAELGVLLSDAAFRRPLVAAATARDPLGLGSFWPWYEQLSDDARAQVLAPVMNKLRAFLLRPELRAVLGQAIPKFDLGEVFTSNKVVLVRLPKGELGSESAQLLGSLLVAHLWRLALARSAIHADRRSPMFIYLDEFQEFLRLPVDLADALVQARGLGVGLVLAHQHLDQLGRSVRAGLLANAASRVVFRLDHDDATVIAKRSRGALRPEDLSGLGAFEAYASLLALGETAGYGSIRTLPLAPPSGDVQSIRAGIRKRFGIERTETEAALRALVNPDGPPVDQRPSGPIGGRRASLGGDQ